MLFAVIAASTDSKERRRESYLRRIRQEDWTAREKRRKMYSRQIEEERDGEKYRG